MALGGGGRRAPNSRYHYEYLQVRNEEVVIIFGGVAGSRDGSLKFFELYVCVRTG